MFAGGTVICASPNEFFDVLYCPNCKTGDTHVLENCTIPVTVVWLNVAIVSCTTSVKPIKLSKI
jgi:hypothetical protein